MVANTRTCLICQEVREDWGKFKKHTMNFFVESRGDTVETVEMVLRRGDAI